MRAAMADETYVLALTTAGSEQQADDIARALVERRLAACVNIVAGCSVYRWEGRVTREEERLLLIKTTLGRMAALEAAIRELHTYDLPELIALPIAAGSDDYLRWLAESVGEAGGES